MRANVFDTMAEPDDVPLRCPYSVGSDQTIGDRKAQEDSYLLSDLNVTDWQRSGLIVSVADGVGGLGNGQIASSAAMRALISATQALSSTPPSELPDEQRLLKFTARAHSEVLRIVRGGTKCACTFICAMIRDMNLSFVSLGDSHIYLCRAGGLLQLNRDHVLGPAEDEREALNLPTTPNARRKAITSYLGKEELRLIDRNVTPIRLQAGDTVLLMSDGVYGTLSDDEIISCIHGSAQDCAHAIIQATLAARVPGQDNATCVVVRCNETI